MLREGGRANPEGPPQKGALLAVMGSQWKLSSREMPGLGRRMMRSVVSLEQEIVFEEQKSLRPETGTDFGGLCTRGQGVWDSCSRPHRATGTIVSRSSMIKKSDLGPYLIHSLRHVQL